MSDEPLAFNIVKIREAMLSGIIVPREIVNKAFRRLDEQLDAKTTKHFSFRGKVVDTKEIVDNGARLQAIDQTISLAGLYRPDDRRAGPGNSTPNFAIEITPNGVIRIATGSASMSQLPEREPGSAMLIEQPVAIPSSPERQRLVSEKDKTIERFNTILDEIVDE